MVENERHIDEELIQELRDDIGNRGWKDSAEFIIGEIEFVADLCDAGQLSLVEIRDFSLDMQVTINTLLELRDSPYDEEVRRLGEAVDSFNRTFAARWINRKDPIPGWSLCSARAWRDHVDQAKQIFTLCCESLRRHLEGVLKPHREQALKCIEEMEKHIGLLRSGRLADVLMQQSAIEKVVLLCAKLMVYADDPESIRNYSNYILSPTNESDAFQKMAAFSRAIMGNDLKGQEEWLSQKDSLEWLKAEAIRLASLYDQDGRLNSSGKPIRERTYLDPLSSDPEHLRSAGVIDKASLEMAEHPDIEIEVEDLEGTLRRAGLNARQRKSLLMRRNGKIMSHKDVNEWKRSQRAIRGNRSNLIRAITEATKKRIIKAPLISAGSHSGVIREGGSYTLPLPDDDKPSRQTIACNRESPRWFDSTPPPISRKKRSRKHLFKKVSTSRTKIVGDSFWG